jgi:cobalt-zinc-cadmium resistance protein CzcA
MINRIIDTTVKEPLVTFCLAIAIIISGVFCFMGLPMDSFPDVSNVQVQVITEPESMAAEEVESLVTVPIETALSGLPGIQTVRSNSSFGLSVVTAIFKSNVEDYFARNLVMQRLANVDLPEEVPHPQLAPLVSTFSNVYMYYLTGPKDSMDLRTLADWKIGRALRSVPGVSNVVNYGGFVKQYQVLLNAGKLKAYNLTLAEVADALAKNNSNAGGNFIEQGGEEIIIRGLGRVHNITDLGDIVLAEYSGTPVKLSQVAKIEIGGAFRRGSASMDGHGEVVTGIVMTRKGTNTKAVVQAVEAKISQLQKELPDGVRIVPYYNQMELVDKTMDTVREILFLSGGLVLIVLTAILLNIRAALIATTIIPLSLLFSFILMKFTGLSANLMTLGAVDFGVIVDAGVVMVENILRRLAQHKHDFSEIKPSVAMKLVQQSAREVGKPILFSILIIISVYIPLFALEGVEGKMFQPLALMFIYALAGALLCSITVIPLICYFGLIKSADEKEGAITLGVRRVYVPALLFALKKPVAVVIGAVIALLASLCLIPLLGSEFIPSLDEGSILLRTKLAPSASHTTSMQVSDTVERIMCSHPEINIAVSRIGRSGMGSDLEGVDNADIYVGLRPKKYWTVRTKDELINQMSAQLDRIPGLSYSFSQPIADMVDDLVSGVKADVAIKVFGDDLKTADNIAAQIQSALRKVKGAADLQREHVLGLPQLNIQLDRQAIARYGLNVSTVQDYIQTALAGRVVSHVYEGNKKFGVLLRFQKDQRDDIPDIENMLIPTHTGARIPLKSLAKIAVEAGTVMVNHEDGQRRTAVLVNVRGSDLGSFVEAGMAEIAKDVTVPQGYTIVWGGQFENQQRAVHTLSIVVPSVLLLIFVLLFGAFSSIKNASLVMLNVPFTIIGGIVALYIAHLPLSVPAIIGFIAVFGVAVQNGIVLLSYTAQLMADGLEVEPAIVEGARVRLRPVLMTASVAVMGLLPKIVSSGTGAEVQRPLATVVLGGLVSATILTLIVMPAMVKLVYSRSKGSGPAKPDLGDFFEHPMRDPAKMTERFKP